MRCIVRFQKTGVARFISHLDLMRAFQRAIRRAGLPVAYSQGFNPHMILSFASALPVGMASLYEIMDVRLESQCDSSFFHRSLNRQMPEGILITGVKTVTDAYPSPMAACERAGYIISCGDIEKKIGWFMSQESVIVKKRGKSGVRDVDIRPLVYVLAQEDASIRAVLAHGGSQTLSPDLLLDALGVKGEREIARIALYTMEGGDYVKLFDMRDGS